MTLKQQVYKALEPLSESDELLKTLLNLIKDEVHRREYERFPVERQEKMFHEILHGLEELPDKLAAVIEREFKYLFSLFQEQSINLTHWCEKTTISHPYHRTLGPIAWGPKYAVYLFDYSKKEWIYLAIEAVGEMKDLREYKDKKVMGCWICRKNYDLAPYIEETGFWVLKDGKLNPPDFKPRIW